MSLVEKFKNTLNPNLSLPAVARGKGAEQRVRDLARCIGDLRDPTDSRELSGGETADWYTSETRKRGGSVSIESAAEREQELKDALDDAVEDENRYRSGPGRVSGDVDAPCRLLKRRKWH